MGMGRTHRTLLGLLLVAGLGGAALPRGLRPPQSSSTQRSAPTPIPEGDESYAVYSAFIRAEYKNYKLIVISDTAGGLPTLWTEAEIKERMPTVEQETLKDLFAKKDSQQALAAKFDLEVKYVLAGGRELKDVFLKGADSWDEMSRDWERIYAKYPASTGILFFSVAGFNSTKTQALIYAGRMCGPLCGLGQYVLLEKKEGAWGVKDFMHLWAS